MKKVLFSVIASSFLLFACSNGTATAMDEKSADENSADKNSAKKTMAVSAAGESGKTIMLTKADFLEKVMNYEKNQTEWIYEGDKPALIDFYADWCGPCKIAAPVLEELAKEYEGRIHIYKVDTQKERELASVFGIQSIPAFLFVPKEGKPTMSNGIAQTPEETKQMFRQMIDELLLGKKSETL